MCMVCLLLIGSYGASVRPRGSHINIELLVVVRVGNQSILDHEGLHFVESGSMLVFPDEHLCTEKVGKRCQNVRAARPHVTVVSYHSEE